MKNQYEIDYQQGYDTCEEKWLEAIGKIRAEIEQFAENPNFGDLSIGASCGALKAIEIIDKYKGCKNESSD